MKRPFLFLTVLGFCVSLFSSQVFAGDNPPDQGKIISDLWASNQKKEAAALLKKWMASQKKSPEPWVLAAQFRCEEGKYKQCLSMAKTALEKSSNAADAFYWKGRAYEAMNKPMDAANEFQAALLAKTTRDDAQPSLDRVLSRLKE